MPHLEKTHLPHFLTRQDVYFKMKAELLNQSEGTCVVVSPSYFYKLWECHFRDVIIPEVKQLFHSIAGMHVYNLH